MASVQQRYSSDNHKYSPSEGIMLEQQLHAVLQENVRSHVEKEVVNVSVNTNHQIRTIVKKQQDDMDEELNPHTTRLTKWDGDMAHLAKKFTGYCEMNQLKEQILAIKETPNGDEEKTEVPITNNNGDEEITIIYKEIIDEDDEKKIELSISKSSDLYEKHMETRGRWNIDPLVPTDENKEFTLGNDVGYYELDGSILLRQYTNCSNLLTAQQARTDVVDEYIVPLNGSKNKLKKIVKQYTADVQSVAQKYNATDKRYKETKEKRIGLQRRIKELMNELNQAIDAENEACVNMVEVTNNLNVLQLEKNEYEKLLQTSRSLAISYNKYIEDVESATDKIDTYFVKRMEFHERNWTEWSSEDVANYIKFLNRTECEDKIKLSNKIDLSVVTEKIIDHGVCGVTLDDIKKNDWIHFGVQLIEDRIQIHDRIQKLIEKYPRDEIPDQYIEIPEEYKCPISGKIMIDPVRCSDNKMYERQNVVQYIQENGKLPGAEEDYDEEDIMVKNGGLKKRIDEFMSEHPSCQQFIQ